MIIIKKVKKRIQVLIKLTNICRMNKNHTLTDLNGGAD